jgi:hypothetical protein
LTRTMTRGLALVIAIAGLAAPTALARQDLRSPDARDAARATRATSPQAASPPTDLRSPDARDAAGPRQVVVLPAIERGRFAEADDFDWGDAALGSGAAVALLLLGGAGALTLQRGRHATKRLQASTPAAP